MENIQEVLKSIIQNSQNQDTLSYELSNDNTILYIENEA